MLQIIVYLGLAGMAGGAIYLIGLLCRLFRRLSGKRRVKTAEQIEFETKLYELGVQKKDRRLFWQYAVEHGEPNQPKFRALVNLVEKQFAYLNPPAPPVASSPAASKPGAAGAQPAKSSASKPADQPEPATPPDADELLPDWMRDPAPARKRSPEAFVNPDFETAIAGVDAGRVKRTTAELVGFNDVPPGGQISLDAKEVKNVAGDSQ